VGSERRSTRRGASALTRTLRAIAWALGLAFVIGWLIGSLIRSELERPERYLGARPETKGTISLAASDAAR